MNKRAQIALLSVGIVGMMGWLCRAAIPGADNPNAYTEKQYRQQLLEFNLRTTVEAYKQVGHRDPKWDEPAIALLEGTARTMSAAGAEIFYRPSDVPKFVDLEVLGRRALAAGCDDPLVTDMFSLVLHDEGVATDDYGKLREMTPLVRKAAESMATSKYPVFRAANAVRRALSRTERGSPSENQLRNKYIQMLYDSDLASAGFAETRGVDRRIIFNLIYGDFKNWDVERQGSFYNDLKSAKAEPWMTNMFGGIYHINAGWASRGSGTFNTVTREGWQGLAKELAEAEVCLLEAYRLEPKYPEAATEMITVVLGQQGGPDLRSWFNRAVEAQFDFDPAYQSYIYALWPRWYGSADEMYQFAIECVDTHRFETRVPMMLIKVLNDIRRDSNDSWDYWRKPAVMDMVDLTLSESAKRLEQPDDRLFLYSQLAGFCWQTGRYEFGRAALRNLQDHLDSHGFELAEVIPSRTASGIYAFTDESGSALLKAETDAATGKIGEAIDAYKSAAEKVGATDPSALWMRGRLQELQWQLKFEAGDWVDITPSENLAGWYTLRGKFTGDGRNVVGDCDNQGAMLVCGPKFGVRWEMRANVEVLPTSDGTANGATSAGVMYGAITSKRCCSLLVSGLQFSQRSIKWKTDENMDGWETSRKQGPVTSFHVECWDGTVRATANGESLDSHGEGPSDLAGRPDGRIAIGSDTKTGKRFRISDIQIRKPMKEPPTPVAP